MTKKIIAGLIGILLVGLGANAQAASCPTAAQPVQIVFEAPTGPMPQDTTASAKDLAAKLGAGPDRLAPGYYDAGVAISARRDTGIQKLNDGTVCAAMVKLTVKLTLERKLWLASELAGNACVLKAFATSYGAQATADDTAVAQFGQTIAAKYQSQVNAIGWQTSKSQEDANKAISDKLAPIMTDIQTQFADLRTAAQSKIDLSQPPADKCDGETEKLGHQVGLGNVAKAPPRELHTSPGAAGASKY
jgi:hypothetical protein